MIAIQALLKDRQRAQRGSVLSGVLIMTAFIAIIAGALMTELSTNFLLSHILVTRVANEATINSAMETTLNQLGTTPLNAPCLAPPPLSLNNRTAVSTITSCWPTVRENPKFMALPGTSAAAFKVDGTIGPNGDYVIGDAAGNVYDFPFGSSTTRWKLSLGGSVTGAPLVMVNPSKAGQFFDALPLSGAPCSPSNYCLSVRSDNNSSNPPPQTCSIPTSASAVISQQAASPNFPGVAFYGDGAALYANDISGGGGNCDPESASAVSTNQPVVAGPIAFRCTSSCGSGTDVVYAVVSDSNSSLLLRYTYRGGLSFGSSLNLPWGGASGLATSASSLPANVAITFKGGGIALVSIATNGAMSLLRSAATAGIMDAPCFSRCGNVIAVGAQDGGLYLYDSSLNPLPSWQGSSSINTTPGMDGAGNWYVGGTDGYVHELQMQAGKLVQVNQYGTMGQVGSSVQVGGCATGICVYVGSLDHNLYWIPLDARDAVVWACISTCSGANPRLWTQVEIGDAVSPLTVHVQGWSYYSA